MWGALIGSALGLGSMGINAIAGAAESRRRQRELDRQERENQLWYDRRYNEVGRERADARRALEAMAEAQRERMAGIHGRRAVMGGSNAVAAAESAAANRAIGDTVGKIDAQQEARRDAIEKDYRQTKRSISNARINASVAQSRNLANAAGQASAMAASLAMGLDGGSGKSGGIKDASAPSVDAQSGANMSSDPLGSGMLGGTVWNSATGKLETPQSGGILGNTYYDASLGKFVTRPDNRFRLTW